MSVRISATLLAGAVAGFALCGPASAQDHAMHPMHAPDGEETAHRMWMTSLPGGWHLMGMAHVFPSVTAAAPFESDSPLQRTRLAFPHAAAMANLESPGSRFVFRFMPNFEGITMPDGEVTFGGWGEGFIDARHPHTLLHEAMLSVNWWEAPGGAFSVSAGRGFAPYGTGDPMYRPALKYPTNHHLSQILERWTLNAVYLADGGLGVEVGVFDGDEPEDWLDVSNIGNFGNSWSSRVSWRFGDISGITAPWELSASYGRVTETHGGHEELTVLHNVAVRHEAAHAFGSLYALVEGSRSRPDHGEGYFSVLGEVQAGIGEGGRHRPFYRVELATRPEYPREASAGDGFFRYDHDDHALGATRWLIHSVGYSREMGALPLSTRPFVEIQHNRARHERGPEAIGPEALFGASEFWTFTAGVRVYLGGGPMRMGSYGVLDPSSASMRDLPHAEMSPEGHEHHH